MRSSAFASPARPMPREDRRLGLGLSIVKYLVEMHGGSIEAHSAGEGRGATFIVKLPLLVADASDRMRRHPQAAIGDATSHCRVSLAGLKILVVDDERDAREVLWHILSERGAEVIGCESVPRRSRRSSASRPMCC